MATAITSTAPSNSSATLFRAWGSALAAQLAAVGLIQTADTGQINWTTVSAPLANSSAGFEVWRFNDALQATAPVYIRIDYASAGSASTPALWFTIGTSTDGAGNIRPDGLVQLQARGASSSASLFNSYISGAANRIAFSQWTTGTGVAIFFSLERTKDAAGADTNDGLLIHWSDSAHNAIKGRYYQIGVGSPGENNTLGILMPSVGTGIDGANTSVYPAYVPRGPFLPYGMNFFAYFHVDIPALVSFTMTVYGATRTMLPLGNQGHSGAVVVGSSLMLRWE